MTNQTQPFERFLKCGPGALTDAELIAVILRTGASGNSAVSLGEQILSLKNTSGNSLIALYDLTMKDLLQIKGIGEVKAVKILCLCEIARRLAKQQKEERAIFSSPSCVADYYMEDLRHENVEKTILVYLDVKLRRISEDVLSVGTSSMAPVSVQRVFTKALEKGASRLILVHNHPSGDPTPSEQDYAVTRRLRQAGELMEIPLSDHIIIGDLHYFSMKEEGVL